MNRLLLEGDPHSVLEGILIAAYAAGASRCFLCINERNKHVTEKLEKALGQMREYSLLGDNILDSGFGTEIEVKEEPDLFVSGEETALIRSLEGKQALPYIRTVYPAAGGIDGKPTLINNVETLACVPAVFRDNKPDLNTKVVNVTGNVKNLCTVEVPFGTTLRDIIESIGGGTPDGLKTRAVQFGGPTGALFDADSLDTAIGFESLQEAGSIMGSGVLEVFGGGSCAVEIIEDMVNRLHEHSCGKCVFCREGSHQLRDIYRDILANKSRPGDMEMINELCEAMKEGCICALGSTMSNPVLSSLRRFASDYDSHITDKKCPADKG
jgi:NADH:ubiquinone oxidoreductase subunit F (NADH-binding)